MKKIHAMCVDFFHLKKEGVEFLSTSVALTWISGKNNVVFFNLPSTRHSRCFCSVYGPALPCLQAEGKLLVVPAGSLDTAVPNKPNALLFVANKANWEEGLENFPKVETYSSE